VESPVIRGARAEDLPLLPSIERRAARMFEAWLVQTGLTREGLEDVSEIEELESAQRKGHLWVATAAGGEVVGFAQVAILDGIAHLDEMDVLPEHVGGGVGTQLLHTVCEWARENGYAAMSLSTFRDVPWNRPFYEKRGFRVVDPRTLGPEHQDLVAWQQTRGLRADLRVLMTRQLA
jgi:GNAT superfamily N-acetyltransferase